MPLVTLAFLAAAQYLALFFFYSAVPTVLRQSGTSLELLGFFGLAYAAFALSFLWAPFVDRTGLVGLGRRRSWLFAMQGLGLLCVVVATWLDPSGDPLGLLIIAVIASLAAATQRIATLGYAVETLRPGQRAWGSTAIGWGGAIGLLLGGSAMLAVVEHYGWVAACAVLALVIGSMTVLLGILREPPLGDLADKPRPSFRHLLRQAKVRRIIGITLPLAFAKGVAFTLLQPRLVDLGVGLSQIALVVGLANAAGFMIIGPAVSTVLPRLSLAHGFRLMTLVATAALSLIALSEFVGPPSVALSVAAVGLLFAAFTVMQVVVSTVFMTLSDGNQAGTDLTTLLALFALGAIPGMVVSGFVAGSFGYGAGFALAAASSVCAAAMAHVRPVLPGEVPARSRAAEIVT